MRWTERILADLEDAFHKTAVSQAAQLANDKKVTASLLPNFLFIIAPVPHSTAINALFDELGYVRIYEVGVKSEAF